MPNRAVSSRLESGLETRSADFPKTIPHSFGFRPEIDLDKLNQLVDELEVDEVAKSFERHG